MPVDEDGNVMEPCDREGAIRECSTELGACTVGEQTCANGLWQRCSGIVAKRFDECTHPTTPYAGNDTLDRTCDGTLSAFFPRLSAVQVEATAVTPLTPLPAGHASAVEVAPKTRLVLRGTGVDDAGSTQFEFRWRLLSGPTENRQGILGAPGNTPNDVSNEATPIFVPTVAGDYSIGVVTLNPASCPSPESKILVRVKPNAAISFQLTWNAPVDFDVRFAKASSSGPPSFDDVNACYFYRPNPDWLADTGVNPSLSTDDPAGCNPETISYATTLGQQPTQGTSYAVYVHYFCNRRGHVTDPKVRTQVCYEPSTYDAPVPVTLRVFVAGQLAHTFTDTLVVSQAWKVADVTYDNTGQWVVTAASEAKLTRVRGECSSPSEVRADCVCASLSNHDDPYCGTLGQACRQRYP